ncbi:unnamed protein product, partial [Gulo gulo]
RDRGVVPSPRAARLSHPLTHGRKVALQPSPSSYFLPRAWLFVELEPGGEEPTPHTTRCPARVAARGPASPGRRHKLSRLFGDTCPESPALGGRRSRVRGQILEAFFWEFPAVSSVGEIFSVALIQWREQIQLSSRLLKRAITGNVLLLLI